MPRLGKAEWALISCFVVLTLLSIYFTFYPEQATVIQAQNSPALNELVPALGICFIVCIIGNLLPLPTPYGNVVWFAGFNLRTQNFFYPALLALVASAGCLIGEMVGYFVGRGVAEVTKGREFRTIQKLQDLLARNPRLAPALIFIFALTPLNDDLLTVPLGFIKYSARKTIFFCWLGKLGMMGFLAYLWFTLPSGQETWWVSMLSLYAIVLMLYLMVKVDWFAVVEKLRARFARKSAPPY
jgi:membrane protein YqaA with SNARE-associated domain